MNAPGLTDPPATPAMIELDQVSRSFDGGRTFAVRSLSLSIARGQFLVLLGESGCGKTTTLKMINRLIDPTAGRVVIAGRDVSDGDAVMLRRKIGYVIQSVGLFPHLTVARNIATVPRLLRWPARQIDARVNELMELIELPRATYRDWLPAELSGGQRQRVGVARALAARPDIMLMDEPFGALDPLTRDELGREYRLLHERLELTTVMVTHDMTEALLLADRIAVMSKGRIIRTGTPGELMRDPRDEYVAALMRQPRRQADRLEALVRGSDA